MEGHSFLDSCLCLIINILDGWKWRVEAFCEKNFFLYRSAYVVFFGPSLWTVASKGMDAAKHNLCPRSVISSDFCQAKV